MAAKRNPKYFQYKRVSIKLIVTKQTMRHGQHGAKWRKGQGITLARGHPEHRPKGTITNCWPLLNVKLIYYICFQLLMNIKGRHFSRCRLAQRDNTCLVIFYAQQTMIWISPYTRIFFMRPLFAKQCMTPIYSKHIGVISQPRIQDVRKLSRQEIPLSKRGFVTRINRPLFYNR